MSDSMNESSGRAISFEASDITRNAAIAAATFILAGLASLWVKELIRNSYGWALALAAACVAGFIAMGTARMHAKRLFKKYGFFTVLPALAAVVAVTSVKPVVFLMLFIIHGLSCFFLRTLKNNARVGVELVMLTTVLASFAYGAKAGALLGATAMLMDYALSARFSYFMPVTISTYALIGLFAGSFSSVGITAVGITAAVIYNIVTSFFILTFMGGHIDKCLRFGLSNIAINALIFTTAAPWLLSILK